MDNVFEGDNLIVYRKFSYKDRKAFFDMFFCLNNVILAMVKSGVYVLPNDKKNNIKSYLLHKEIEQKVKQEALQNYKYENIISQKEVLLSCIGDLQRRKIFDLLIKDVFITQQKNNNYNLKLLINRQFYFRMQEYEREDFKKDIFFIEHTINIVNNHFKQKLPSALKKRIEILSKIKHKIIPEKAKVKNSQIDNIDTSI